jgi:predicted RNase H-like HicB family nuclease
VVEGQSTVDSQQFRDGGACGAVKNRMKYVVIVEKGANSFGAYLPDLPGCAVVGETREEALQLIREAVELHVSAMREQGAPLPEPASSTEYVQV